MILTIIIALILILFVSLFMRIYPTFGGRATKNKIEEYQKRTHYTKGRFMNQVPTSNKINLRDTLTIIREFVLGNPNRRPFTPIPIIPFTFSEFKNKQTRITWFGHSAFLLEMDGKTILADPMFGHAPTPFPWFSNKRYSRELPFKIDELPNIDFVLISHDHYDHLDYHTIKKLRKKVNHFLVPLGVASHLERWGISKEQISEYDWYEEDDFAGLQFVCTPARHFSGRSLTDGNATLWSSWVIKGTNHSVFFSGDSSYAPHFKEIGEKYGPFDLTLIECGQYDERWRSVHMMPEETVQAHLDVKGNLLVPIHWGGFTLALHNWTDPIERVTKTAFEQDVLISTPKIGETVTIGAATFPSSNWWR